MTPEQEKTLLRHLDTYEGVLTKNKAATSGSQRFAQPSVRRSMYRLILDLDSGKRRLTPFERASYEDSEESIEVVESCKEVTDNLLDGIEQIRGGLSPEVGLSPLFSNTGD